MAKIKNLSQLQEALDQDFGWRVKEISTFKLTVRQSKGEYTAFTRAGVAIAYAHWEGFVKLSSENYLNFVSNQNYTYKQLRSCFAVFGLKSKIEHLKESRQSVSNVEVLDFIRNELSKPSTIKFSDAIDTNSNLTSRVFSNIASSVDINISSYLLKFKLIDESLVAQRNRVAHGEYIQVNRDTFFSIADEVVDLMRLYKTDIENGATLGSFLLPLAAPL